MYLDIKIIHDNFEQDLTGLNDRYVIATRRKNINTNVKNLKFFFSKEKVISLELNFHFSDFTTLFYFEVTLNKFYRQSFTNSLDCEFNAGKFREGSRYDIVYYVVSNYS